MSIAELFAITAQQHLDSDGDQHDDQREYALLGAALTGDADTEEKDEAE